MLSCWFWLFVTAAVVIWYSTITVYVAWKGIKDIKNMLGRLGRARDARTDE
jgi:hypothetical protein